MASGALVALVPDDEERRAVEGALSTACRGTWGNCNRGGQVAIGRLLTHPTLRPQVDAERRALVELLDARVAAWNEAAADTALRYPRYRGGFFTTVFCDDAEAAAAALREDGIFVVPVPGGLRVGLCALPTTQVASTVRALARVLAQA